MTLIPLTDCCLHLGIDPKTLRWWLKSAQLASCLHPSDARIKCLTHEQLAQLARLHDRRLPDPDDLAPLRSPDPPPASSAADLADLRQQIVQLQAQVQTLQTQLTDLALTLLKLPPASPLFVTKTPRPAPVAEPVQQPPPPLVPALSKRPLPQALIEAREDGSYAIISQQEGLLSLLPDSPEWFAWIASLRSFRFQGRQGSYSATRKLRRGLALDAWNVHATGHGRSCSLYLSKFPSVTIARLEEMAAATVTRLSRP